MRPKMLSALAALALIAGCGGKDDANMPNAMESQGLNEGAEMLDTSPDSLVALDDDLGNGEAMNEEANETALNEATNTQ